MVKKRTTHLPLFQLKRRLQECKKKPVKAKKQQAKRLKRFTLWHPGIKYRLVKKTNKVFSSLDQIEAAFQANRLSCDFLQVYQHVDPKIGRDNPLEPKYAAVFCLERGSLVLPQQPHYRQCYINSGRTQRKQAYSILPEGEPYWCCLYAERLKSQRLSKKKYTDKRKKKKRGL